MKIVAVGRADSAVIQVDTEAPNVRAPYHVINGPSDKALKALVFGRDDVGGYMIDDSLASPLGLAMALESEGYEVTASIDLVPPDDNEGIAEKGVVY